MREPEAGWPQKTRELHNHHFDSTVWNDFAFRQGDIVIELDGKTFIDTRFHKQVSSFLSMWARNIKAQGWAEGGRVSDD